MSAPTSTDVDRLANPPKPSPEGRIWLRDLPTPPELLHDLEVVCQRYWFWEQAKYRRFYENEWKLRYYFGGQIVSFVATPRGYAVVALGNPDDGGLHRLRDQLAREERHLLRCWYVEKWNNAEPLLPASFDLL